MLEQREAEVAALLDPLVVLLGQDGPDPDVLMDCMREGFNVASPRGLPAR